MCCSFPDYERTASGLQYKDLREGTGPVPQMGQTVVIDWAGFTIGYYGRVFEARNKVRSPLSLQLTKLLACHFACGWAGGQAAL